MLYNLYSVRDVHVGFGAVIVHNIDEVVARDFSLAFGAGVMAQYPGDYALYQVATFDLESGAVSPLPVPRLVLSGLEAKHMLEVSSCGTCFSES